MGLEKSIKSGKEHRKEYRGGKAVASSCRNHGGCPWCYGNRTYKNRKINSKTKQDLKIFWYEEFNFIKENK